ncbi:WD40 repeat domain-containing protein [Frigoriglobus tundricola]|uniref:Uncharacterized protein n=1 Tax=Frigoriglobus tundricola TaxID=2774151 RepID=A0A6M5YHG0_9BACT|nr:WD40 repeat domain-containing protein [Frigoriglobus tundricola]QJW92750.1 hypothetical protein FTUN_0247 [Frigoriglobus tundricola]
MTGSVLRVRLAAVAALALVVVGSVESQEPDAPTPKELKEAVGVLRDVYETDYQAAEIDAKAKVVLARKLFDGAPKRKTAVLQYAFYDEARRLAATGGDSRLALDALVALTSRFKGAPPELASETLKLLGAAGLPPGAAAGLIALASEAAADALDREDYAGAVALGKLLVKVSEPPEDPTRHAEAKKLLARAESLKTAVDTIKTKPDDPFANEVLGRYWALTRGRWDVGVKYLARGTNVLLAAAAVKDAAEPKTAKERTAAADAWFKLAKDYRGAEHRVLIDRAWEWYSAALAVAAGDEDLKPAERIKEIQETYPELFDQTLEGHTGAVAAVAVTPDGKTLVSVSNDKTVRLWDGGTGKLRKVLDGHTDWVGSLVLTRDGARAVTAGGDNTIRVWDLKAQKELKVIEGHTVAVRGLALTADGRTLISGAGDKTCRAWDLATGTELKRYGSGKDAVESVAVTLDGKYVLAGNDAGGVTVYEAKSGDVVSTYDKHEGARVPTIVTTADGKTAISGGRDKDIHVWDIATGKEIRRFKGHSDYVYQLALSPDGKSLLSASSDKTVCVWDVRSGKELKKFEGHTDGVQGACFAPDGRFVFSASWDRSIRKWRLSTVLAAGMKKVD